MKISLIISLVFHILLFFTLNQVIPFHLKIIGFRTYQVDLMRPPIKDIDIEKISSDEIAGLDQERRSRRQKEEDTISLDTKDERYMTYAGLIKASIMEQWRYPEEAKENLVEGSLTVIFSLGEEGNMLHITINRPSGHEILDQEAVKSITNAAPFPPFPAHITAGRLNIIVNFDYRLTARK